jgi:hypothetical protein
MFTGLLLVVIVGWLVHYGVDPTMWPEGVGVATQLLVLIFAAFLASMLFGSLGAGPKGGRYRR